MHDSVTGPIRSQDHDSSGGEAHGAEYLHENVKNPLRQPSVCSQLKERLALPEHDGSFGTQNEARTMKPEGSSEERSILWENPQRVSQDPVGEESVAYVEAYPEPVGREVGHNLVDQERTDTGSTYVNIVDHALRDPEQRDGTGMERTPDDELTSDPLSPRMASTSEVGERIRAIAKVPPDDDPDQSRREADGVPRGITIAEHDPVMPNKQSTTQKYTDSPDHEDSKPSSDQCPTSRQASLARDDVAAQVDLAHPSARQSRKSSSDSTTTSLFPPLGELSEADGPVQTSAHEKHMEHDPTGKPPSASPRPESCSQVTVAAPAESYPAPLFAMQPAVAAPPEPLETPSPSAEPYQTASIASPASTSPITQPVGAAVASSKTPTPNPFNVEVFPSSFAGVAAGCPQAASPQLGSPPLAMHTIGSSEELPVPPTCAKPDITTQPTSPMVDSLAASNEESISLSSDPRSRLLHGDVSSATLSAREKGDESGAALGCKPLSPLTGDVSPPAAVQFDTDHGASSTTDEPFSSPLAHKGRRIRQTSVQRAPTPAIPKPASRLHPHVIKRDRCAEGSSQIEWPGDAIHASYGKFGLDAQRLIIVPEAQPFNPLALFMSSTAKVGAKLTPQRMKVLQKWRDELLASLPAVDDLATGSADIDLIKGLCNLYSEPVYPQDMTDLIRALRQRQKVTKDAVDLLQCLESFALVVTKYHASAQDYFASASRPAAILLLLEALNGADMIRQHADQMRHLISKALPSQESRIGQMTPLGMLHKMTMGFMPQGAVESALGYDSQYLDRAAAQPMDFSESVFRNGPVQPGSQIWSFPPTVVTPAMDRKRGIALVDAPGDGDGPTKRHRGDEDRTEHFGTRASNEGRFVPLETDSPKSANLITVVARCLAQTLTNSTPTRQLHQHTVVSGTLRTAHKLNDMLTCIAEPTVVTAAESECEDSLNDIVNGDVTPVRYDPAFAATPNTLKRKRGSSDRSQLGKRALIKVLLRKQGDEGFVPHQKHPENPGRKCHNTHAVRKDDTSKGLRFLHLSTETARAGSPSEALTQHDLLSRMRVRARVN
ncbi:hypothetical protein LTR53_006434 [Teratosphaeriaceae sp. CCFEE 6253]|nr:hypothetical protein LTR53_006434 [Teratosphaeriaceae sp. CCFEE 6253]